MRRTHHAVLSLSVVVGSLGAVAGVAAANADTTAPAAPGPFVPGHVLVSFDAGTSLGDQSAIERANGATAIGSIPDLHTVILSVPVGAEQRVVGALQRSGKVRYAELDGLAQATATPNDTYWSQQWGLAKINAPAAWDTTLGSSNVIIADLDTGVDSTQPDLQGKLLPGWDFVNGDSTPNDDNGHGTSTAGIIGALTDNAAGIAGTCPDCVVLPVKVLDSTGSGSWSGIANGITWATDHGARVINMSLSSTSDTSTLHTAVQYAWNHGAIVVGSAGNNGNSTPVYPAAYPEALSVAATTNSDTLYTWSDYGSWVKVAAPGCTYATRVGGTYASFCGTSASAPFVSGVLGLMLSSDPSASGAQLVQSLEATSVSVGNGVTFGRVDTAAAVGASSGAPAPSPTTSPSPSPTPSPSGTSSPTTTVSYSGTLTNKVTNRSYSVTVGAGTLSSRLDFNKAESGSLQITDSTGTVVATSSGSSPVTASAVVPAGTYAVRLSSASRMSYTLAVIYASS